MHVPPSAATREVPALSENPALCPAGLCLWKAFHQVLAPPHTLRPHRFPSRCRTGSGSNEKRDSLPVLFRDEACPPNAAGAPSHGGCWEALPLEPQPTASQVSRTQQRDRTGVHGSPLSCNSSHQANRVTGPSGFPECRTFSAELKKVLGNQDT